MELARHSQIVRRTVILGITAVLTVCTARSLQASCGDYLHTRFDAPANSAAMHAATMPLDLPADLGAVSHVSQPLTGARQAVPLVPPCRGPECHRSNDRDAPLAPPVSPVVPSSEALHALAAVTAGQNLQTRRSRTAPAIPRAGFPWRPERPPQFA